jgi:hypothetical protein
VADDLRAQLVKVLWEAPYDQEDQADAIVPVVEQWARGLVAYHLRAAAELVHDDPEAAAHILRRADAMADYQVPCGNGYVRPSGTIYCDLPADHEGHHTAAGIGSWAR